MGLFFCVGLINHVTADVHVPIPKSYWPVECTLKSFLMAHFSSTGPHPEAEERAPGET